MSATSLVARRLRTASGRSIRRPRSVSHLVSPLIQCQISLWTVPLTWPMWSAGSSAGTSTTSAPFLQGLLLRSLALGRSGRAEGHRHHLSARIYPSWSPDERSGEPGDVGAKDPEGMWMDQLNVINGLQRSRGSGQGQAIASGAMRPKERKKRGIRGLINTSEGKQHHCRRRGPGGVLFEINRGAARVGRGNLCRQMDRAETRRSSWNVFYSRFASPGSVARPAETGVVHGMQLKGALGQEPMRRVPSTSWLGIWVVAKHFTIASQKDWEAHAIARDASQELMIIADTKQLT